MTPTLSGRLQTRTFLLVFVGFPWLFLIGLVVPRPAGESQVDVYQVLIDALLLIIVIGFAWELLYHALQQLRWEKDWPTLYGLLLGIPEGVLVYFLLTNDIPFDYADVPVSTYVIHFASTWVLVWLAANGPMRAPFIRWRFRGGRLV